MELPSTNKLEARGFIYGNWGFHFGRVKFHMTMKHANEDTDRQSDKGDWNFLIYIYIYLRE